MKLGSERGKQEGTVLSYIMSPCSDWMLYIAAPQILNDRDRVVDKHIDNIYYIVSESNEKGAYGPAMYRHIL